MPTYSTKQRRLLLEYLSQHIDEQFSARQIAAALSSFGISLSAVYRNLALMEKIGEIHRSSKSGSREVYYQYRDPDRCEKSLHLSCKKCGAIIHLDPEETDILINRIAKNNNFIVARSNTTLYGICGNCRE